ncbi:MAG: hypothetical protein AAB436_02440 [Patescibacteria group bacterium]
MSQIEQAKSDLSPEHTNHVGALDNGNLNYIQLRDSIRPGDIESTTGPFDKVASLKVSPIIDEVKQARYELFVLAIAVLQAEGRDLNDGEEACAELIRQSTERLVAQELLDESLLGSTDFTAKSHPIDFSDYNRAVHALRTNEGGRVYPYGRDFSSAYMAGEIIVKEAA